MLFTNFKSKLKSIKKKKKYNYEKIFLQLALVRQRQHFGQESIKIQIKRKRGTAMELLEVFWVVF
jgi:hypothetical protein